MRLPPPSASPSSTLATPTAVHSPSQRPRQVYSIHTSIVGIRNPEVEIEPELGPELDKVCVEELKGREKSLVSDVIHSGPITIELENLSHGRNWVTVLERSSEAGGMDVTKMEFPECGKIFEVTDAEVSFFTNDGGQQRQRSLYKPSKR